jgi:hypothetical protein
MRRTISAVLVAMAIPAHALAQSPDPLPVPRESVSVGVATNFAVEGSGPWFAPGVRLGVPLGARAAVDLESSAVFGGKSPSPNGSITSFLALNIRLSRAGRAPDATSRYWIVGLRYMPIRWPPEKPEAAYDHDLAFTAGYGWDQIFQSRRRVGAEIGFSGGRGFLVFATLVFAVRVPH